MKARDVSVRDAQEKIEKLKRMMTETEMLEAQAELQEMATGMVSSIGGSGDTLNRVEEYLTERRDKAAGKARVAASTIDTGKVELMEAEQQALADAALTEFAAAYGIDAAGRKGRQGAGPAAARRQGDGAGEAGLIGARPPGPAEGERRRRWKSSRRSARPRSGSWSCSSSCWRASPAPRTTSATSWPPAAEAAASR